MSDAALEAFRQAIERCGEFPAKIGCILNADVKALPPTWGGECAASPTRNTEPS